MDPCPDKPDYIAFDGVAGIYEETRQIPDKPLKTLARILRADFGVEGLLLDAGCGTGRIARRLSAEGISVIGADVSTEMLQRAKGSARLLRCDLRSLPIRPRALRGVFLMHVLHLVRQWHDVVSELRRALAPGGVLYAVCETPRRLPAAELLYASMQAHNAVRSHVGAQTFQDVLAYLRDTRAELIAMEHPDLSWRLERTPAETLDLARRRVYSDSWLVPPATYAAALSLAERVLRAKYPDMNTREACEMRLAVWRARWEG